MTTKSQAIDQLADALAGSDIDFESSTTAGRISELAAKIADGTIVIGGGSSSGGGGGLFVVTMTKPGASYEIDKSVTEIADAIEQGSEVVLRYKGITTCQLNLVDYSISALSGTYAYTFSQSYANTWDDDGDTAYEIESRTVRISKNSGSQSTNVYAFAVTANANYTSF